MEQALSGEWISAKYSPLVTCAFGYALLAATVWTSGTTQVCFVLVDGAFFLAAAIVAFRNNKFELPRITITAVITGIGILVAGVVVLAGWQFGTLHKLFGKPVPWFYGVLYFVWAIAQQWIQQAFFYSRLEPFLSRHGAGLIAGALFGLIHLPNPVLAPVTFVGGWLMSEVFRRYRSVVPLGIVHGLVGLAIAVVVPDHINHQMEVGLGYLQWGG